MARKSGVKQIIFDVWEANLDWPPKEIRTEVHRRLGLRRSKNNTYPGLRLVQSYIKEFKDNLGQSIDEDKPWSIAASVKYGLPPEATKDLFDIWRVSLAIGSPISIRQAKWIVHIRELFYQPISTGNMYSDKVSRNLQLISQSWLYAILERASRVMGERYFDTVNLDAASFMSPFEHQTVLQLGKVSPVEYSQEALAKLEKHGTSLTSPPISIISVEQAVWHSVRAEPPSHMEIGSSGSFDEVLPEEDDLVAAHWLNYLSKGPLWNALPPRPEVVEEIRKQGKMRKQGYFIPDSGGFPDDSLYSRQLAVRNEILRWVKKNSTITGQHTAFILSPKLLTMVGYKVSTQDRELYANLHESELKQEHPGWNLIPAEVQKRLINDEQNHDDLALLEDADNKSKAKQKQREQEFVELVEQKGGPLVVKSHKVKKVFWESIRDEWIKRYPSYAKNESWYLHPELLEVEYARLIKERDENDKNSDSI
jgi:hypothetical protein